MCSWLVGFTSVYNDDSRASAGASVTATRGKPGAMGETYIQMTACGSLDLDVPRRNLRRWSFVSWEKV